MKYSEVLDFLYNRLPMYQRTGPAAYKDNLDNTVTLDEKYGNPHRKFKSIHVAGTNGKGSVSHMLASVFQSAGYKTGLYTSPHLKDFRERIRINGVMVSQNKVVKWVENFIINNKLWKIEPSFFELTAIMAFDFFALEKVDIAIVEVGLGGRLDSTNILVPALSVITNIGLDHTSLLGDTLEKIALEKAGIIKKGIPVVIGATQPEIKTVFENIARQKESRIYFADQEYEIPYTMIDLREKQVFSVLFRGEKIYRELKLDLGGIYQRENLPAVLKTVDIFREKGWKISEDNLYGGLSNVSKMTGLMGRWQVIGRNPKIICDTAHNAEGIARAVSQLNQTPFRNLHVIFGMVSDKDPDSILRLLPQNARYYFTKADIPRALNENILKEKAAVFHLKGKSFGSVKEAFYAARENALKDDVIFIGGSTFVVAEIL